MKLFFKLTMIALLFAISDPADCQSAPPPENVEQPAPPTQKSATPAPATEKVDTQSDVPLNPFDPGLPKDQVVERALGWFSELKILFTLLAGWILKLIAKRLPNFKFGKYLPAAIFAIAFIGFGVGYGWDVASLLSNTISIVTALALHSTVLNPAEALIEGNPSSDQKKE
jgi:hypothetical protein